MSAEASHEKTIAVYDSCVLYPAPLRDLLMWLAISDLFRAKWSEAIHDEWIRNVLDDRPDLTREQLERTRQLMNAKVPDCLVTGYEPLIENLVLPDLDDRHVLAAAIQAQADVIVTFNLKDFPAAILEQHRIVAQDPDEFVCGLIEQSPEIIMQTVRKHHESLVRPPKTWEQYIRTLRNQRLVRAAARIEELRSASGEDPMS